ncbi:hypothetical protein CEXT_322281 [Caerostris extrusa]|uniref:Uncharacterized protein n=1 Tax=Caerostris extrusa TaxID=172846 RepID=A0AAV4Q4R6_CAEEX|nr:hypothetical protein CEXT_322281 [Caerostris extrusa]
MRPSICRIKEIGIISENSKYASRSSVERIFEMFDSYYLLPSGVILSTGMMEGKSAAVLTPRLVVKYLSNIFVALLLFALGYGSPSGRTEALLNAGARELEFSLMFQPPFLPLYD